MLSMLYRGLRTAYSNVQRGSLIGARSTSTQHHQMQSKTRIVAVGDVHGAWGDSDVAALQALAPGVLCGNEISVAKCTAVACCMASRSLIWWAFSRFGHFRRRHRE